MTTRLLFPLLAALLLASCPNPMDDKDLRSQIAGEVGAATAKDLKLTVEATANGIVAPAGVVDVKEGIPLAVSATPFQTHALVGWRQTAGPGVVSFEQTASGVEATLHGGNATIAAILVARPKILYTTPIGNDISRNTSVSAVFSTQIDFDTISLDTFKLLRGGNEQVTDGSFSISADGRTVKFDPVDALAQYSNYVISVAPQVNGFVNLSDYQDGSALIVDDSLLVASEYTAAFRTGKDFDNEPPSGGSFNVVSSSGDPAYTGTGSVRLDDISATDNSGQIAYFWVKNRDDAAYQAFVYDYSNPSLDWQVSLSEGRQYIDMYFEDPNGNKNSADITTRSILVDTTGPDGTLAIDGYSGSVTEFVNDATVSLTLAADDPDIATDTGNVRGSGVSTDGSNTANRMEMRFGNTTKLVTLADWEPFGASKAGWVLASSTEGLKAVYAQFRDAVGNVSSVYRDLIYVDPTPPSGSFVISGNGVITNDPAVTLGVSSSDGSGSGLDTLQVAASTGLKPGSAWSAMGASGTLDGTGASAAFAYPTDGLLNVVLADGADGDRLVNLRVKDKVGNSTVVSQTITLDTTPPLSNGSVTINGGAVKTPSASVTLQVTAATDALSNTAYMAFANADSPVGVTWLPVASTAAWTLDTSGGTTKTVYAWFQDAAGNVTSSSVSDTIELDTSPPTGTMNVTPTPTTSILVAINCNVTDATQMRFSNNNSTWSPWEGYAGQKTGWNITTYGGSSTNGTRTVYGQFKDDAGNVTSLTASYLFDNTAPSATISVNAGAAATNYAYATLTLSASDNVYSTAVLQMQFSNDGSTWSGWQAYTTTRSSWSLISGYGANANQGTKTVWMRVKDPLGNTRTVTDSIVYDTVAPSLDAPSLNAGAAYTNNHYVTITLNGSDATSGVSLMRFSNNASAWSSWQSYAGTRSSWDMISSTYGGTTTEGTKYAYVQVQDLAGNVSSIRYDAIVYDITPPSGYFTIESSDLAITPYTDAFLYFYVTDNLSGVSQRRMLNSGASAWSAWEPYTSTRTSPAWYLWPTNGLKTVYAQFVDGAGNYSSAIYDQTTLNESYASLTAADISTAAGNAYMSTAAISGNDPIASSPLAPGSVLVYYTSAGRYGKMEIVSFNKSETAGSNVLTINLTTYNANGTVYSSRTALKIRGTYSCDLDAGVEVVSGGDFFWRQDSSTARALAPQGGAKFAKWK